MTMRTTEKTITHMARGVNCFRLSTIGVVTDEELIEGLSFVAYHRVSTIIFVRAPSGSAVEMVTVDPLELEAASEDFVSHAVMAGPAREPDPAGLAGQAMRGSYRL